VAIASHLTTNSWQERATCHEQKLQRNHGVKISREGRFKNLTPSVYVLLWCGLTSHRYCTHASGIVWVYRTIGSGAFPRVVRPLNHQSRRITSSSYRNQSRRDPRGFLEPLSRSVNIKHAQHETYKLIRLATPCKLTSFSASLAAFSSAAFLSSALFFSISSGDGGSRSFCRSTLRASSKL
jgi:hypothetical protein